MLSRLVKIIEKVWGITIYYYDTDIKHFSTLLVFLWLKNYFFY
jgi:hypothetical protein